MDSNGVKEMIFLSAAGINHKCRNVPARIVTNTFLIVMIPHTLKSQKLHVWIIKLISHRIRYPNATLINIAIRPGALFGGHNFVCSSVKSSAGRK